jgi:hypothetical protein
MTAFVLNLRTTSVQHTIAITYHERRKIESHHGIFFVLLVNRMQTNSTSAVVNPRGQEHGLQGDQWLSSDSRGLDHNRALQCVTKKLNSILFMQF